jgi:hypothetical protein
MICLQSEYFFSDIFNGFPSNIMLTVYSKICHVILILHTTDRTSDFLSGKLILDFITF